MNKFVLLAVGVCASSSLFARLRVEERDGSFSVLRDGRVVVSRIAADVGAADSNATNSFRTTADGSRVWNRWCEERNRRFRLEIAERADGAIEVTLLGEVGPEAADRRRFLVVEAAGTAFSGKAYEALEGSGRGWQVRKGVMDVGFKGFDGRHFAADGIDFDFNPIGPGDDDLTRRWDAVNALWRVARTNRGDFTFTGGGVISDVIGGFGGAKVIIREGSLADYDRYHFLRTYHYSQRLPVLRSVAFGSPRHGDSYADGDIAFSESRGYGWVGSVSRRVHVGAPEGAFYSNVSGAGPTIYRFAGLADGFYVLTASIGNWTGVANEFSVSCGEDRLGRLISVPARWARTLSKAVHVTGGVADVRFDGEWIVSALSLQPVLADGEDLSVRRGFWFSDGYEPATIYRNCDYAEKPVFPVADETFEMPPQGGEMSGAPREPARPVELPDPGQPSLAVLKKAKIFKFLCNNSTLAELDDPGDLERHLDRMTKNRDYNIAMLSGMHSRHTYARHLGRGVESIGRYADALHRRGILLFDHHDATLLWNIESGFRVFMERLDETSRFTDTALPSQQFCINNEVFKKTYFAYLRALVEKGVDGFQLDEVCFWPHGCACAKCRADFHRDTGWWMPLNECDVALRDPHAPLAKRLFEWRKVKTTNWFVDLRRYLKDVKPDLVLNNYTTHWGLVASLPSRRESGSLIDQGRVLNFFGTEVMPRNPILSARALLPYRRANNIFSADFGAPVWGWFYGADIRQSYFCWGLGRLTGQISLLNEMPVVPDVPDFETWGCSAAGAVPEGAKPVAKIAVLFSAQSRDWNRVKDFTAEAFGLAQELEAMHVPYAFVSDLGIEQGQLARYKMLLLGAAQCLSDAEVAAIRKFAEKGGQVRYAPTAATRDALGEPRSTWPLEGCPNLREMPSASRFYCREISPPETWTFNPDPADEAAFRERLSEIVSGAAVWSARAPDKVYTSLWKEPGGTVAIHFLNATGADLKPGEKATAVRPGPAFPPLDEDIVFTLRTAQDVCAVAVSPDFTGERRLATVRNADGTVSATLPKECLTAYTLVRVRAVGDSLDVR